MPSQEYNATVSRRVEIAPGLIVMRIIPDTLPFRFRAGQYTVLGLRRSAPRACGRDPVEGEGQDEEKMIRRAYSIASGSREDEFLEFYLALVESGELSPRLFALKVEDRLFLGNKSTGMFTLERVPAEQHVLLVGTGTGLAPYVSMIRTELECGGPRKFVVLHGAHSSADLGYRTELTALARLCSNLIYIPSITGIDEEPGWTGPTGYLQDILFSGVVEDRAGLPVDPEHVHVFLCGNPGMIEATKARLLERGFSPDQRKVMGNVHTEEYW